MTIIVTDHLQLKQLLAEYDYALDHSDVEGFVRLFTPDGRVETDDGSWAGEAALAEFVRISAAADGTAVQRRHDHPDLGHDGDSFRCRSFGMTVQVGMRGGFGNGSPSLLWLGYHDDELRKTDDGFRFVRRSSHPWVGDVLSRFAQPTRMEFV